MRIIGVTGGIGAGKSAIVGYIKEHFPARILIADEIAHDLMEPGQAVYDALRRVLPDAVFGMDQSKGRPIDRASLAELIFSDGSYKQKVNHIVHPAVKEYIVNVITREREVGEVRYIVMEAALLIEDHYDRICDELWYVYASEETRRRRLQESRGYSSEKIEGLFRNQLREEEYRRYANVVIDNDGASEMASAQITALLKAEKEDS